MNLVAVVSVRIVKLEKIISITCLIIFILLGTVYKAKWLSKNRLIACKVINARPEHIHHEKSFRKELAAYAELSGPYILKTYGYNIEQLDDDTRKCTLVMEYMPRGSLTNVLRQKEKLPLRRKLEMACQIASGMRKLHAHRMIHRDIRPDNILVTEDYTAKIGDMGLARVWLPDVKLTTIGCLPYMPLDFYTGKYDQSLDVYTFGLTINQLFTEKQHQFDLLTRRIELTKPSSVFADLITRCIHKDPSQRPTAIEIETTLRMYKQAIEKYILEKNIKYARMSTEEKNSTFITVYEGLQPELDKLLKNQFPPPCPAGQLADGMNGGESEFFQLLKILELLGVR
jgi:serine/threonine protein kinase